MGTLFMEPGTDATFDGSMWIAAGTGGGGLGAATSDSAVFNTPPRSIKCDSGTFNNNVFAIANGIFPSVNQRISGYFRFTNLPGLTTEIILVDNTAARYGVGVDSGNLIQVTNGNGTIRGGNVGANQLVTGTWYRISVAVVTTSTTVNELRVFLNGVLEATATNVTLGTAGPNRLGVGWAAPPGANRILNFDDIYVDDSSALTDTGNIHVTAKLPSANNTNTFGTAIGANPTNRWTNVNERPPSITNGWKVSAAPQTENYGIQAAAAGDVDVSAATIVARTSWVYAATTGSGSAAVTSIYDNGSTFSVTLGAAAIKTHTTDSATYPSNAAAVGLTQTSGAHLAALYECGMMIAYIPSAVVAGTQQSLALMGVGH